MNRQHNLRSDNATNDAALNVLFCVVVTLVIIVLGAFGLRRDRYQQLVDGPCGCSGQAALPGTQDRAGDGHAADAPPQPTGATLSDQELDALLAAEEELNKTAYHGGLTVLPIRASAPFADAYAYTDCSAIYFVTAQYEHDDWPFNLEVLRHEVAHTVVGCDRGHDAAWQREFDRINALYPAREDTRLGTGY